MKYLFLVILFIAVFFSAYSYTFQRQVYLDVNSGRTMIVERAFSININQQIQETNFSLAVKHYKLIRGSSRFKYMGESRGFLYRSIKLQTIFHGKLNPYWDQIRYRLDYVGGYLMNREYQILKNSNASEVNMVVKENKMIINEIIDVASRSFTELNELLEKFVHDNP